MTTMKPEQEQLLSVLEDNANMLRKALTNWKKTPKARITKGYIEARMKIVEEYWKALKHSHDELVKITPKTEKDKLPYFNQEEFFIYEDLYVTLQGELKDVFTSLTESSRDIYTADTGASVCNHQSGFVHLPKIQLPIFTSSYEQWPAFKDLFISLVHENSSLSDVQKLHYLKTSLKGESESILQYIQVVGSNYSTAWDILNTRFGNKRLIVNNIMKRLFNQKKMTSQSATQLKLLVDTTTECLNNLSNLKVSTDSWDLIIIYLLVQKLDSETHKDWEQYVSDRDESNDNQELPTWKQLKKFMETKFRTLELVTTNTSQIKPVKDRVCHVATPTNEKVCIMCSENHSLCHCRDFISMGPSERTEYVKNKHLCFNCLASGHSVLKCKLPVSCRICHRRHHSLLHDTKNTESGASTGTSKTQPLASQHAVEEDDEEEKEEVQVNTTIASHLTTRQGVALLATAVVEATNEYGLTIPLRALIDQGSQATFISEKATQLLKLNRQPVKGSVVGVGSTRTEIKHAVKFQLRSKYNRSFNLAIQAYVMSKQLTTMIPAKTIPTKHWPHLEGLNLADPTYCQAGSIDILLGVREYAQIIQQNLIKGPPGTPCAQNTNLGWILFGDIYGKPTEDTYLVMHHQVDVDEMLKSIWELELDNNRHLTKEEKLCEDFYEKTTTRNPDGRYVVKLPFKKYSPQAINTKEIAIHRFLQLERKFKKSPEFKLEYTRVIDDYIQQGHMEEISNQGRDAKQSAHLPHHAVIRNEKETSQTRVVFDASCKGINHISLNDKLHVGPQLQDDLRYLLTRWRMKRVCFMADIRQMYRQILVSKEDADFQRIFWREDEAGDLKEYRLLRVTFGTAPAPYLAVKTLHQVAIDEGEDKPLAVQSIKTNFYMDDWLDGADDERSAIALALDVTRILKQGGFELTKWSSNNINFMKAIDTEKRSAKAHIDMNLNGTIKALGIVWNLSDDTFQYNLKIPSTSKAVTKRSMLSDIQKLFDPLGWIAASTVKLKILIQKLWLEKVTWDENVSEELREEWTQIRTDFANVNNIQVPRWVGTYDTHKTNIQLHGFSDASMRAYAAAVYIRVETSDEGIETHLIAARTRVAPLKTISLPRLELSGALLLSKLMKQVGEGMKISTENMYAWTDSSIVVAWMSGEPNRWKPFVANRVVEIAENLNNKQFYHVESSQNPADLASRGVNLSDLKTSDLWWKGPSWLSETEIKISKQEIVPTEMEMKSLRIKTKTQLMGDLPSQRVTPARPFLKSGVDFLGPFQILMSKGRGNKTTKMYVAIFICMVTKNTHLELVGDMTSAAFIGAFRRFVARRGKCSHLWSDQGRNFVGANKELRDDLKETLHLLTGDIAQMLATDGTQWHYIPAYSPSFGGLWETGVKSVKYHLKRIITTHLTYEEMTTLLCQKEACLNSRPLCPIDDTDPDNTDPLTPGHFLIGEAPIVIPSPDERDVKVSSLSRWRHTQKLLNDFWRRWQDEYLSRLQQRNKWLNKENEFKVGDIVLIKDDNLPPGKWSLGRIVNKHPGTDGFTRVYSVKSGSSVIKRTVTKLCALPIDST